MRVLALTNLFPGPHHPYRGTFNRQQFEALAREHEVTVIAPVAWTDKLMSRKSAGCIGSTTVHRPTYFFPPKVLRQRYGHFMLASARRCFHEVVRGFRPDVVLASWAYPDGWASVRLAREAGLPVAVKVHGSDILLLDRFPRRGPRTIEALMGADRVIAVSENLAATVRKLGVPGVEVVYNGIDRDLFRPGSRSEARARLRLRNDQPHLLFVGNLIAVKGVHLLVEACERLRAHLAAFQCSIIGQGSLKAALAAQIERRGLAGNVTLLGPRRLEELPDWYRAADVLVLPSLSEGVPNVVLEATACGTPVVASRVGGVPEVVAPDALVPPGNPVALADAIAVTLKGPPASPASIPPQPGSWLDSARALAAVLEQLVPQRRAVGVT